ncbi:MULTISPECIES: TadE/TadG family type IV pilus assembly protein [unclassified Shewanella]|uniref:TadE/TadG family type IV pilus assembly protein n=1 Tax=unclassified Shewanella TaxID=196818 RepID=UPI001BBD30D9|nr:MULTISPECIES: TadE family protein [unclassified Shewanella]GIU21317.1 pilus biosynthesis protein TadE [Shewanella sp. MBTL60-112-B1]GIU39954.1 pilus biosynthesis protein TadE [Shewanella sp. MBTL60-112-B2]
MKNQAIKKQGGVYVIEFTLVAVVFFVLLFAAIEFGRLLFTYNVLHEASRRAARLAVVCQVNSDIDSISLFNDAAILPNLSSNNLTISYLAYDGTVATGIDIDLVRAEIINYQHQFIVPGLYRVISSPTFSTTLPRESLGVFKGGATDCSL